MATEQQKTPKVESAPPAKKTLTPEEREKLRAQIRTRMSKSKLEVVAPPGWHAYWARKDDSSELARLDFLGFRMVREPVEGPRRYKAQGAKADGTYIMGDVILMEIPEEEYDIMMEENSIRSRQMAEAAKQQFRDEAERKGAPTFVVKRGT